ncbi:MAG TPA: nucleotide exchange factor GrpE [Candidatus Flavonifractor intestinipullorum]|uniref:Protein GrpE n=1 Tax=Candidatus Flavonifractor intestinipullorum TaxID=2838587 RepID=A0A9D2MBN0_9FIRM|nr:nucleotide exchange factor GrpE [Candidatus Flavonifractor intestinipullorum]
MSKKEKQQAAPEPQAEENAAGTAPESTQAQTSPQDQECAAERENTGAPDPLLAELESLKDQVAQQEDKYLRLAAEYDNYRRRTTKEKNDAYTSAKADAVLAFLPVYDNLERALKQETADAAYKKGVEMTMTGLKDVLAKLGVEEIPAQGEPFDPNVHNAVMHVEDESVGAGIVVEVFQAGFRAGEKVIRAAMVKVAN